MRSDTVYCTKCGSQNPDDAAYCFKCGNKLAAETSAGPVQAPTPAAASQHPAQGKSAVLAALLNLFFGLGYVYLGYKKVLGVPTIVFVVLVLVVYILIGVATLGIITLILAILFAVDGYQKGKGSKGFINAA